MRSDRRSDPDRETGSAALRDDDGGSRKQALNNRIVAVGIAAIIVLIDQASKSWAVTTLADGPIVVIDGFFKLRLTFNTGASFSSFSGGGPIIAIVVFGVIGFIFYILGDASRKLEAVALGFVLGGAVGNLIDRVFGGEGILDGAVVDFLAVSSFAVFNVADMAVNLGVVLLFVAAFWKRR